MPIKLFVAVISNLHILGIALRKPKFSKMNYAPNLADLLGRHLALEVLCLFL